MKPVKRGLICSTFLILAQASLANTVSVINDTTCVLTDNGATIGKGVSINSYTDYYGSLYSTIPVGGWGQAPVFAAGNHNDISLGASNSPYQTQGLAYNGQYIWTIETSNGFNNYHCSPATPCYLVFDNDCHSGMTFKK